MDPQTVLLALEVALSLLTCDYAASLHSYSFHILVIMCYLIAPPVAHGPHGLPLMISLEYCNLPPVQRPPSFVM